MRRSLRFAVLAVWAAGISGGSLSAQDVYTGNAAAPLQVTDGRPEFAESIDGISPPPNESGKGSIEAKGSDVVSAVERRFQWGFRLNLRGVYDDNIFLTPTDEVDDYYFAIEPGVTLGWGDIVGRDANYIRLDYAPSIFIFTDQSDSNAVQHLIRLEAHYNFGRLGLSLSQDVQLLDGTNLNAVASGGFNPAPSVNLDAGGNTDVNVFTTHANMTYDLTGKTFLSGGAHFSGYDYNNGLIDSGTLSGDLFINYTYSPKLTVGLGGTFGYNWVDSFNPDQTYEQGNLRVTYQISGKVSLNASAGIEFRQFEENFSADDEVSPVYELGAEYQPFDGTSLTARGSRRILNSAVLAGNNYASTNITFGARQRLLRRIYLGLAVGYENSDYYNTIQFVDGSRNDDYFFIQPAVDVTLAQFWTVGAYYLHRENNSSSNAFGFDDNQVGVRTSLTF